MSSVRTGKCLKRWMYNCIQMMLFNFSINFHDYSFDNVPFILKNNPKLKDIQITVTEK